MTYSKRTDTSKKAGKDRSPHAIRLPLGKSKPKTKPAQRKGYKKRKR